MVHASSDTESLPANLQELDKPEPPTSGEPKPSKQATVLQESWMAADEEELDSVSMSLQDLEPTVSLK